MVVRLVRTTRRRFRLENGVDHVARRSDELDVEKVQPAAFTCGRKIGSAESSLAGSAFTCHVPDLLSRRSNFVGFSWRRALTTDFPLDMRMFGRFLVGLGRNRLSQCAVIARLLVREQLSRHALQGAPVVPSQQALQRARSRPRSSSSCVLLALRPNEPGASTRRARHSTLCLSSST